jgi:hypothetical protein
MFLNVFFECQQHRPVFGKGETVSGMKQPEGGGNIDTEVYASVSDTYIETTVSKKQNPAKDGVSWFEASTQTRFTNTGTLD